MADLELSYPDLDPAPGWIGFRASSQIRLIPPDTPPAEATCAIIVSPLLAKSERLPPPDVLIEQTIAAEVQANHIEVVTLEGPEPFSTESGLSGISVQATVRGRTGLEKRIYVLVGDDKVHYGINYLSTPETFDEHVGAFWAMAKTMRPFRGKVVEPDRPNAAFGHYDD